MQAEPLAADNLGPVLGAGSESSLVDDGHAAGLVEPVVLVEGKRRADVLETASDLAEHDGAGRVAQRNNGVGDVEAVGERVGLEGRVDHDGHGAEELDRAPAHNPLDAVVPDQADERALAHTLGAQPDGKVERPVPDLRKRRVDAVLLRPGFGDGRVDHDRVAALREAVEHELAHRLLAAHPELLLDTVVDDRLHLKGPALLGDGRIACHQLQLRLGGAHIRGSKACVLAGSPW